METRSKDTQISPLLLNQDLMQTISETYCTLHSPEIWETHCQLHQIINGKDRSSDLTPTDSTKAWLPNTKGQNHVPIKITYLQNQKFCAALTGGKLLQSNQPSTINLNFEYFT